MQRWIRIEFHEAIVQNRIDPKYRSPPKSSVERHRFLRDRLASSLSLSVKSGAFVQGNRSRMRAWMYAILITMISCHLRAERDLNYRYLAWRGGAAGPSPFLITGCARAFQESDSRHNSVGSPGSIFTLPSTVPHFSPPTPPSLPFACARYASEKNLPTNRSPSTVPSNVPPLFIVRTKSSKDTEDLGDWLLRIRE